MSAVIANEPEPKPPEPKVVGVTVPSPKPQVFTPPQTPTYRDRFTPGERWALRLSGIAALAVGVGFIVQGFVELDHHGEIVTQNGQQYRRNTADSGQPLFFSLGSVLVVGGTLMSVFGWRPWPVRVAPAVSANGAQLQLQGTF
jgi:hypothetical protein